MTKANTTRSIAMALALLLAVPAMPTARIWPKKKKVVADTVMLDTRLGEMAGAKKMVSSAYPVEIQVTMNAVQVKSQQSQILPIYTRSGAFYMAARLSKGTNWINGLPRGHYFINNRPITIN